MKRVDLEALIAGDSPITRRTALKLAETLVAVIDCCNDHSPADDWGGHKLAYITAKRVVSVVVSEAEIP